MINTIHCQTWRVQTAIDPDRRKTRNYPELLASEPLDTAIRTSALFRKQLNSLLDYHLFNNNTAG